MAVRYGAGRGEYAVPQRWDPEAAPAPAPFRLLQYGGRGRQQPPRVHGDPQWPVGAGAPPPSGEQLSPPRVAAAVPRSAAAGPAAAAPALRRSARSSGGGGVDRSALGAAAAAALSERGWPELRDAQQQTAQLEQPQPAPRADAAAPGGPRPARCPGRPEPRLRRRRRRRARQRALWGDRAARRAAARGAQAVLQSLCRCAAAAAAEAAAAEARAAQARSALSAAEKGCSVVRCAVSRAWGASARYLRAERAGPRGGGAALALARSQERSLLGRYYLRLAALAPRRRARQRRAAAARALADCAARALRRCAFARLRHAAEDRRAAELARRARDGEVLNEALEQQTTLLRRELQSLRAQTQPADVCRSCLQPYAEQRFCPATGAVHRGPRDIAAEELNRQLSLLAREELDKGLEQSIVWGSQCSEQLAPSVAGTVGGRRSPQSRRTSKADVPSRPERHGTVAQEQLLHHHPAMGTADDLGSIAESVVDETPHPSPQPDAARGPRSSACKDAEQVDVERKTTMPLHHSTSGSHDAPRGRRASMSGDGDDAGALSTPQSDQLKIPSLHIRRVSVDAASGMHSRLSHPRGHDEREELLSTPLKHLPGKKCRGFEAPLALDDVVVMPAAARRISIQSGASNTRSPRSPLGLYQPVPVTGMASPTREGRSRRRSSAMDFMWRSGDTTKMREWLGRMGSMELGHAVELTGEDSDSDWCDSPQSARGRESYRDTRSGTMPYDPGLQPAAPAEDEGGAPLQRKATVPLEDEPGQAAGEPLRRKATEPLTDRRPSAGELRVQSLRVHSLPCSSGSAAEQRPVAQRRRSSSDAASTVASGSPVVVAPRRASTSDTPHGSRAAQKKSPPSTPLQQARRNSGGGSGSVSPSHHSASPPSGSGRTNSPSLSEDLADRAAVAAAASLLLGGAAQPPAAAPLEPAEPTGWSDDSTDDELQVTVPREKMDSGRLTPRGPAPERDRSGVTLEAPGSMRSDRTGRTDTDPAPLHPPASGPPRSPPRSRAAELLSRPLAEVAAAFPLFREQVEEGALAPSIRQQWGPGAPDDIRGLVEDFISAGIFDAESGS